MPCQVRADAGCARASDPHLHWTCLTGVNLVSANLADAQRIDVKVFDVTLSGADLTGVIGYP